MTNLAGSILFMGVPLPVGGERIYALDVVTRQVRCLTAPTHGVPSLVWESYPRWSPSHGRFVSTSFDGGNPHLVARSLHAKAKSIYLVPANDTTWIDEQCILCSDSTQDGLFALSLPSGTVCRVTALDAGDRFGGIDWHPQAGLVADLRSTDPVTAVGPRRLVHVPATRVKSALAGGPLIASSELSPIGDPSVPNAYPRWSPAGTTVVHVTVRSNVTSAVGGGMLVPQAEIALTTVGLHSRTVLVTDDSGRDESELDDVEGLTDYAPTFSPDGAWIAWVSGAGEDGGGRIVARRVHANGLGKHLTIVLNEDENQRRYCLDW